MEKIPDRPVPEGFTVVTKEQFFAAVWSTKRNVNPTTEKPYEMVWRDLKTREMWGWQDQGWKGPYVYPVENEIVIYALSPTAHSEYVEHLRKIAENTAHAQTLMKNVEKKH